MVLACALVTTSYSFQALQAQSSSGQTAPQTQNPPPPPKPKTKPPEPIDPNETAGVRGPGSPVTVRVMLKSKTVEGAHVVVKNAKRQGRLCHHTRHGEDGPHRHQAFEDKDHCRGTGVLITPNSLKPARSLKTLAICREN
jgi:hypothetical protein